MAGSLFAGSCYHDSKRDTGLRSAGHGLPLLILCDVYGYRDVEVTPLSTIHCRAEEYLQSDQEAAAAMLSQSSACRSGTVERCTAGEQLPQTQCHAWLPFGMSNMQEPAQVGKLSI
jgi:hypothetical protein